MTGTALLSQTHAVLQRARERARRRQGPVLASAVLNLPTCDPLAFFDRNAGYGDRMLWICPGDDRALVGVGAAQRWRLSGATRFADMQAAWRCCVADAEVDAPAGVVDVGPVAIGGFSFEPQTPSSVWERYPDGLLTLPRYLLTRADGKCWVTVNTMLWPESSIDVEVEAIKGLEVPTSVFNGMREPTAATEERELAVEDVVPADEWKARVSSMTQQIRDGAIEKVVLARECRVHRREAFSPSLVLRRLRAGYPNCFVFAIARGKHCFLGATPELLARLDGGEVRAMCLAGSTARGATDEEDRRLGELLLASRKDRAEHAIVVSALREALAGICLEVRTTDEPTVMKLPHIQHLLTKVTGRVAEGRSLLDLVERIHPTPAVAGHPREAALQLIRQCEGLERGWYAGLVGWLDARGEGEFAVAIRSALIRGTEARLFAGCGIVAASDPDDEYVESGLKLRPILSALKGE